MADPTSDEYSAGEQSLGYTYQARLALLHLLQFYSDETAVYLEKDDDLDFIEQNKKSLNSLKHKAKGDKLTDLSTDFWKSVRIWLKRFKDDSRSASNLQFFLLTTGKVSDGSFLNHFLPEGKEPGETTKSLAALADAALARSRSQLIGEIKKSFDDLDDEEKEDFLGRVLILDNRPRIEDIPKIIKEKYMRAIRREFRDFVFERLEGWWTDSVIKHLTGERPGGIFGYEVSDSLSKFADEYKSDNLPITFRGENPSDPIDIDTDQRIFVLQLKAIGTSGPRIKNAILDYYRAFSQRASWAREHLLNSGEIDEYEDRLLDEWARYRDLVFEELSEESAEDLLKKAGAKLYQWAEFEAENIDSLRIRARVTEPYIRRGSFHILANDFPRPKLFWHPQFLSRLAKLLGVTQ